MIKVREEAEILQMLRESSVKQAMVEKNLDPPSCRLCGAMLTPAIGGGRLRYLCPECDRES